MQLRVTLKTTARSSNWPRSRPSIQRVALPFAILLTTGSLPGKASAQALPVDEPPRSIHGTVVNAVTKAPIGRALVSSPDNRFATLTDGEGHFEFVLPKATPDTASSSTISRPYQTVLSSRVDNFWLMARKPGFLDDQNEMRQTQATPGTDITLPLVPESLITGRVILSESDAALGVDVDLFVREVQDGMPRWIRKGSTRANSDGEFRFAELLAGTYKLGTSELPDNDPAVMVPGGQQYGFPPVYFPGAADFATAGTLQVGAGQTVQADLSLARRPYYPVQIPVPNVDASAGLNVTVSLAGHRGPGYSLGYNAQKGTIEGLLPNGHYLVEAETFGQHPATGAVNLAVAGAPAEGPDLMLTSSSSIRLHVTEEFTGTEWNGTGTWNVGGRTFNVHGPRLYLQATIESEEDLDRRRGASLRPPTGPTDDTMVIENVAPGRYWLRLTPTRGYVAAATMGGVDVLHQPLVVSPGSSTRVEVKMRDDTAEIEGTIAGVAAEPATAGGTASQNAFGISAIPVYCIPLPDSSGQFQQLWASGSDGKFDSQIMAPGTYRVLAFKNRQPNLPYRDPEAMKAYDSKGQVVHLSAGEKASVQLQIVPDSE
jgi:hypothetical protein